MAAVPYEKLMDGYLKCIDHVSDLIEASVILYHAKKYSTAIPLAILALEEYYKIMVFQQQLKLKQGISEQRWQRISRGDKAHMTKLGNIYADSKEEISHLSEEKYQEMAALRKSIVGSDLLPYGVVKQPDGIGSERLAALNEVKKHCFYLNWDDPDWSNFCLLNTESEQEAVAAVEIHSARFLLVGTMITLEWPTTPRPGTPEYASFESHPLFKEDLALTHSLKSPEFQEKIAISQSVLDRYRKRMKTRK